MASMRVIKRKIKSVTSTQQITKAMHLVASSKLQRAKNRLAETKPYSEEMRRAISEAAANSKGLKHYLLEQREVKQSVIIVLTGDRGLCGGYNVNVCKAATRIIEQNPGVEFSLIMVGTKGRDYFVRRRRNIRNLFSGISEKPMYDDANDISRIVLELFSTKATDKVYLVYTSFKSAISQEPTTLQLLPVDTSGITADVQESEKGPRTLMEYEPGPEAVLEYIIPKYVTTMIFSALTEAAACEQGARMTSMDSATENAEDMIGRYTLQYNRARQGAITQEITEIVSGANALE